MAFETEFPPKAFEAEFPPKALEAELKEGDGVKVSNSIEKFWVTFMYKDKDKFFGKVDSHLINECEYKYGDLLCFEEEDILEISNEKTRQEQQVFLILLVMKFQEEHNRKPTIEELDYLTTIYKV